MPNNEFIGRKVGVGVGIETTYGTAVAPAHFMRHTKLGFQRNNTRIENNSAMGRNEGVNDSAIVEEWAEGPIEGKVYDQAIGYFLYNMFGSLVTTDNADSDATVKDHTCDISNSNIAKSLTVTRIDPLSSRRHAMATLEELNIEVKQGDWAMMSGALKALPGTTSADTAAYVAENSFTSKHVTVKLASNEAGLAGATGIAAKSLKINMKRDTTAYFPFGSTNPSAINTGRWTCNGEITLRYTDTTLEALWAGNTQQALQIALVNTDVTIGAAANPALKFTAPKVRLHTFEMGDDLDEIIEQTLGFTCELDATAGYMLRAVLTNTKASY